MKPRADVFHGPAPAPAELRLATWLWLGSIAVGAVLVVASLFSVDETARMAVRTELAGQPALDGVPLDTLVRLVTVVGAVLSLLWSAAKVGLVLVMRSGRGWARTVLTVVGAVEVVLTVAVLGDTTVPDAVARLVGAALVLAAGVAMFTGDANPYLAPRRTRNRPGGGRR
ncbi:MAG: hypothetical protein ABI181_13590 [Mycobacteriaceae bacterium]